MKVKKTPTRMCVGCQQMKEKRALTRIVRTPEGEVVIDKTGKKSGRGAYVCPEEACINKAYKEKRLDRALDKKIDAEIYQNLLAGLDK